MPPRKKAITVTSKEPGQKRLGRPIKAIDWTLVDNLAAVFCNQREIYDALGVDQKTFGTACVREKGCTSAEYIEQKRDTGRRKLRLVQMRAALSGNITMMIWLGKNMLQQTDKQEIIDKKWAERTDKEQLIALGRKAIEALQAPKTAPADSQEEGT